MTTRDAKTLEQDSLDAFEHYVQSPAQAQADFERFTREIRNTDGITTGSRALDRVVPAVRGGQVLMVIMPTGHGKTQFLNSIAKREAIRLEKLGTTNRYSAVLTYETAPEHVSTFLQRDKTYTLDDMWDGKVSEADIIAGGLNRASLPLYIIGESMMRSNLDSPEMTITKAQDALRGIWYDSGKTKTPSLLCIDYIQEVITSERTGKEVERMLQAIKEIVRLGQVGNFAIVLASQARQEVMDRKSKNPMPGLRDSAWSARPPQKATTVLGGFRPFNIWGDDPTKNQVALEDPHTIERSLAIHPDMLLFKLLKVRHRKNRNPMAIPTRLNGETLEFDNSEYTEWF